MKKIIKIEGEFLEFHTCGRAANPTGDDYFFSLRPEAASEKVSEVPKLLSVYEGKKVMITIEELPDEE